jgi:hypothetical protein
MFPDMAMESKESDVVNKGLEPESVPQRAMHTISGTESPMKHIEVERTVVNVREEAGDI